MRARRGEHHVGPTFVQFKPAVRDREVEARAIFDAGGWIEELRTGAATARYVADEFDKAAERLRQEAAKSENSDMELNLAVTDLGQSVLSQIADGDRRSAAEVSESATGRGWRRTPGD